MTETIIRSSEPVTLLGAAPVGESALAESLRHAPRLIAADGGAETALSCGNVPEAVFGDFDSIDAETLAKIPSGRLNRIAEQDSTDFDKSLRHIDAPLVLAAGFTGGRIDHELAVYNALVRHSDRPCIVLGESDICFHAPPSITLDAELGMRLSLFPMAEVAGSSSGLRWPIDGIAFAPSGRVGTSNEAVERRISLQMRSPGMLIILPRSALTAAIRALVD